MKGNVSIERINVAAFGKLQEKDIKLAPHINLISAPNEGGKTTLTAFIRFALYGFKGRSQSVADNPKKLYSPWSGAAAAGGITLQTSRRLRIERSVVGNKETALCTDATTGAPIFSTDIGEGIFGVSCDVFEKTLYLSAAEPHKSKDGELADKLQNIVFSADEQMGCEKAEKLLSKQKNALKGRTAGSGRICELETKAATLEQRLAEERAAAEELKALEASAARTAEEIKLRLEEERDADAALENYEKYEAFLLTEEHKRLTTELESKKAAEVPSAGLAEIEKLQALKNAADKATDRRKDKEAEYAELCSTKAEGREISADTEGVRKKHGTLKALALVFWSLGIILALATVLTLFVSGLKGFYTYGLLSAMLFVILGGASTVAMRLTLKKAGFESTAELKAAEEQEIKKAESFKLIAARTAEALKAVEDAALTEEAAVSKLNAALKPYGADAAEGDTAISELLKNHIDAEARRAETKSAATALEIFEGRYDLVALKAKAEGATVPEKTKAQLDIEKKAASQRISMYKDKQGQIAKQIAALKATCGNPLETAEALSYTEAELAKARASHRALTLAIEELTAASNEMKESISPLIAGLASKHFSDYTEGAHGGIELDTSLALSYDTPYGPKSGDYLSTGARDGVYLCLRLALIDLLFEGKKVPLILDDAFAHMDNHRTRQMLKLLGESGHQLIINCCTGREEKALEELGLSYNRITL